MKTNQKGIDLIKSFESLHDGDLTQIGLQPKLCPANVWTVGWGHAIVDPITNKMLRGEKDKKRAYELYPSMTIEEADILFKRDLQIYERHVLRTVKSKINENQFSALVSFCYNIGGSNFNNSRLLRLINTNPNQSDAIIREAFLGWKSATVNGVRKVLNGLVRRRNAECDLYFTK
jgi:lysozyme